MKARFRLAPRRSLFFGTLALFVLGGPPFLTAAEQSPAASKVSYYREIRPILQANCQGCHQPAKSKGGYVMTDFKKLLAGGESEGAAIVAKHPEKSAILKMITPQDGEVRMPKGKNPLMENEVALIQSWIQQGALDDTPADAKKHYDAEHPPVYTRAPVISSLDFSPDGKLLAIAGFHEVLLYENNGETLVGRLIGISERVQSLRFSPDGQWLAWGIIGCWAAIVIPWGLMGFEVSWVYYAAKICAALIKILIAAQVCRFFTEARRNGMLELLLCTPLRGTDILRGQWLAMQRIFLWPTLVFILCNFLPMALAVYGQMGSAGMPSVLNEILGLGAGFAALAAFALYFIADVYAICWFGTWLSLTSKKPALAPLWTIVFVVILPSAFCFLDIIADLFFILWAVIKLNQDLRTLIGQQYQPPRASLFRAGIPPIIPPVQTAASKS